MHWTVAAPFLERDDNHWLTPYVPGERHQFQLIPSQQPSANWHNRHSSVSGWKEWVMYWQQGKAAIEATQGGVITVFPQLAATVGLQQQKMGRRIPVVAWLFNVGTCNPGIRRLAAQLSLHRIDRFIVHTRRERVLYSQWLNLPDNRFEFVPYQAPEIPIQYEENETQPFIVSLGSAHRDFPTLFKAVEALNLPTIVASGKRALEGLPIPAQVQTPFGISRSDCLRLAQEARINVIPLMPNPTATAAGQVTLVEAMRMGRAIIATRCHGADDYIQHGETGLLVDPQSVDDLKQAIEQLWNDPQLRQRLGNAAKQYAAQHFSDEAAGIALGRILDSVADQISVRGVGKTKWSTT
ncbi:glycosyltransferase family 4 protein [Thermocoleostomius sinensis]|uniref:Glycosyltransferase n=1 Tax=Thermocoleostomius sinensis A174 TaxID=2016057 RepID=A0A9E8Z8Y6_9CYAN|nr:glycosyltransferase [Thermocoleostomius sinensis]WAL58689.1 glycosyltransferase [Thermocoleostomius sinensis A174]